MKKPLCGLAVALLVTSAVVPQVVIESLDRNGNLTWTNSVSNATYRVEWTSSPTGVWQDFNALTNLLSLHATSTVVTVQVPMLYRVVWTDAPPPDPAGQWRYSAYDLAGNTLYATGRISLWWTNVAWMTNKTIWGNWEFENVGKVPVAVHPFGHGQLGAWGYTGGDFLTLMTADAFDDNLYLYGSLSGNTYRGDWEWIGWGVLGRGKFAAEKIPGGR